MERIPTPKVPVTGTEVYEILSSMEASMKRLDQCGFLESLKKINKWGFESERNRKCIVDNGTAATLANAFVAFSSDDDHQSLENVHYSVLEEILSSLNWMFPFENKCPEDPRIETFFEHVGFVDETSRFFVHEKCHFSALKNEIALGFFDRILDSKEGREAASGNDLTMPVLVKKILRVSELATEHSVSSIWKLSRFEKQSNERRVLFEALQVGVFQKLVVLLQCGCGDSTKEKATQLLKLLNPYRSGLECIESSDFKNLKRSF
ncbi:hypothetical protein Q3G72_026749 [Acer saccharum]|nr:hypothetical protein Q3G72_026749 [Acer saccharum]